MTRVEEAVNADVIVVGAGNAGTVAALAAHERGARVLLLEAAPLEERGGNSRFAGAVFRFVHEGLDDLVPLITKESAAGAARVEVAPYSREQYWEDALNASMGRSNEVLFSVLMDRSRDTMRWMAEHGVQWELSVGHFVDPAIVPEGGKHVLQPGTAVRSADKGEGLIQNLFDAVEKAGIETWYDSPVMDLLWSGSTCEGVVVRRPTGDVEVRGTVILASGGFEANPEMRRRWLGPGWDLVKVRGTRFNMGTVLNVALEAGAQASGHWGGCHASPIAAEAPQMGDLKLRETTRYSWIYGLMLNRAAERFADEGENLLPLIYAKTGAKISAQEGACALQLFDSKTIHLLNPYYHTSVPLVADTLEELAEMAGVDAAALVKTVSDYNAACTPGEFDPFRLDGLSASPEGQPRKSNWAQPIDQPPYTIYEVAAGITFTYGGLAIDEKARVLDTAGRVMPGLYATGEITGDFFYHNYTGGAGLMMGAVYGRIAAEEACGTEKATA